jgi:hypothetical protein
MPNKLKSIIIGVVLWGLSGLTLFMSNPNPTTVFDMWVILSSICLSFFGFIFGISAFAPED